MAAMLDFQVANRVNFISIPMGLTVPNLVLVSQFARFFSYPLHYQGQVQDKSVNPEDQDQGVNPQDLDQAVNPQG